MNIEEKAKAYDEALGWMREMYPCLTDSLREDAEHYFPELAESEDERIRKAIIHYILYETKGTISEATEHTWVKWLEKQKEQNGEDEFLEDELSAFLQNYDKEYDDDAAVSDVARHFYEIGKKQKEQKPHTDEEKEYIRTIKSIISDFIRDKKPENLAYYQRIYDWLDGRHVPFSCGHENGEPADPVFSKQEYESYPIISEDTTSAKLEELDGKALLYTADKSYQIGFRDGVASVKQKWSAEDEEMLEYVIGDVNDAKQLFTTKEAIDLCDKEIAWLKSLPEKFNLQSKQECGKVTINGEPVSAENYSVDIPLAEWSKEDKKDIAHIIRILDDCYAYGKHDLSKIDHENLVNKLKSLRPSWKPSEEQMSYLLSLHQGGEEQKPLRELIEQLKKLM